MAISTNATTIPAVPSVPAGTANGTPAPATTGGGAAPAAATTPTAGTTPAAGAATTPVAGANAATPAATAAAGGTAAATGAATGAAAATPGLTGAVKNLTSFVKSGQDVLQKMTTLALANADKNGGNFSQSDLVTIQQRQTQVTTANDLAHKLQQANEQMLQTWRQ